MDWTCTECVRNVHGKECAQACAQSMPFLWPNSSQPRPRRYATNVQVIGQLCSKAQTPCSSGMRGSWEAGYCLRDRRLTTRRSCGVMRKLGPPHATGAAGCIFFAQGHPVECGWGIELCDQALQLLQIGRHTQAVLCQAAVLVVRARCRARQAR
eukprot:357723-Chlamydomonas_euryale.AAC.28